MVWRPDSVRPLDAIALAIASSGSGFFFCQELPRAARAPFRALRVR